MTLNETTLTLELVFIHVRIKIVLVDGRNDLGPQALTTPLHLPTQTIMYARM